MDGQSGENGGWEELLARVLLYELAAEVAAEELAAARGEILSMSSDDDAAPAGRSEDEAAWEDLLDEITEEVAAETHREAVSRSLEGTFTKTRARLRRQALLAGRFERIESIGAGVYGTVYKVRDGATNDILALKRMRVAEDDEEGVPVAALREVSLLKNLAHPNIVPLREALFVHDRIYLLMELMDCNLREYVSDHGPLNEQTCANFTAQILAGVAHLHERRILHRDLKPQNILVRRAIDRRTLKISDFGLSRAFARPRAHTREVVTLWYRAPEILLGAEDYSTPVDVWSVGCILAEMAAPLTAHGAPTPLFPGDSEIDQLYKIFRILGTPSDHEWPGVSRLPHYSPVFPNWPALRLERVVGRIVVQDHAGVVGGVSPALAGPATNFLERCLAYEPSSRITAREALAHWFIDPFAADRATAAAAARAAAQALSDARDVDDLECELKPRHDLLADRKFGSSHSAFTTPARQKRARIVTPDDGRVSPLLQGLAELAVLCDRSGARAPTNGFVHIDQMMAMAED